MAIEYSNLFKKNEIMFFGSGNQTLECHQEALKPKVITLLQEKEFGASWLKHFLHPSASTMILQQDFLNSKTMCAIILPDETIVHFDSKGSEQREVNDNQLDFFVHATWEKLKPKGYKTGLVLSASQFKKYMNNMCDNFGNPEYKDRRFAQAFRSASFAVKGIK